MSSCRSILVKGAPPALMKRKILKSHFSKYGTVVDYCIKSVGSGTVVITFATHAQALSAKSEGHIWEEESLQIEWAENAELEDTPNYDEELNWYAEEVPILLERPKSRSKSRSGESAKRREPKPKKKDVPLAELMEGRNRVELMEGRNRAEVVEVRSRVEPLEARNRAEVTDARNRAEVTEARNRADLMEGKNKVRNEEEEKIYAKDKQWEGSIETRVATTLAEKLQVLKERDKKLRSKLYKDSDIKTAVATKGTCPDMCPEKERIMRIVRRLVSCYEVPLGKTEMDHALAVKEYSRSSADQEEPLQHELRPEPVLTLTMAYLVTRIMCQIDEDEGNAVEWYDFCWDRLRAIRKDIIQQQLCDLNTVTIVEQCARFHIACFDRLLGYDVKVFDEKINTENLMNCLQSLMHMYEDLRHRNVVCPNEAEFNAYMILLKLNSGDLLWEYQQYPAALRTRPQLKAAVRIHTAYNNNMYSAFFRLVRETTYLNACLLQRFFTHVRSGALRSVVKAYCPPNKRGHLLVGVISEALKFDCPEDAVVFCQSHGLRLTESEAAFAIVRNDYLNYDSQFVPTASSYLIRDKRVPFPQAVVGENAPLPVYVEHEPHSSFNKDHILNTDALDASDQEDKMLRDIVERELYLRHNKAAVAIQQYKSETAFKELLTIKQLPQVPPVSDIVIPTDMDYDDDDDDVGDGAIDEVEEEEELPEDEVDKEVAEEEAIVSACSSLGTDKSDSESESSAGCESQGSPVVQNTLQQQFTLDFLKKVEVPEIPKPMAFVFRPSTPLLDSSDPNKALKRQSSAGVMESHPPKLLKLSTPPLPSSPLLPRQLSTTESPFDITPKCNRKLKPNSPKAKEKRSPQDSYILEKLKKKLHENMKRVSVHKYARIWKRKVERIRQSKAFELESGLPLLSHMPVSEYLQLWGCGRKSREKAVVERLQASNLTAIITKAILNTDIVNHLEPRVKQVGRRLVEALGRLALQRASNIAQPPTVFFKLVFALPENTSGSTLPSKLELWCRQAFYEGEHEGDVHYRMTQSGVGVYTSVRSIQGIDVNTASNMSALVLVKVGAWESDAAIKERLTTLLRLNHRPIPVAVLTVGDCTNGIDAADFDKEATSVHQAVWKNMDSVMEALLRLTHDIHFPEPRIEPLSYFVEAISERFLDALHEDSFMNDGLAAVLTRPDRIFTLYNRFLVKVKSLLEKSYFSDVYGTACEFKLYVRRVSPTERFPDYYDDGACFKRVLNSSFDLLELVSIKWPPSSSLKLYETLKAYCAEAGCSNILSRVIRMINPPDDEDLDRDLVEHLNAMRWLPIVEMILGEKFRNKLLQFNVVYCKSDVQTLFDSHWWLETDLVIQANKSLLV